MEVKYRILRTIDRFMAYCSSPCMHIHSAAIASRSTSSPFSFSSSLPILRTYHKTFVFPSSLQLLCFLLAFSSIAAGPHHNTLSIPIVHVRRCNCTQQIYLVPSHHSLPYWQEWRYPLFLSHWHQAPSETVFKYFYIRCQHLSLCFRVHDHLLRALIYLRYHLGALQNH